MKKNISVVTFGEVLWDIFEIAPGVYRRELGGAPANLAVGLARLGASARVIGGVGLDSFGDTLVDFIRAEGVDARAIARLPNRTGITFVHRDAGGEPSFLFYRHDTADMVLGPKHVRPSMLRAMFAVCGTSTSMGEPLASATKRFVRLAAQSKACVVVDLNVRAHLWPRARVMRSRIAALAEHAELVKASTADLRAVGGESFLAKHAKNATWLITDGAGVARAIGVHGEVSRRALPAKCVDATGAGDAFLAGVLATLSSRGATPGTDAWRDPAVFSDALRVGHMLGKKAVSKVGAVSGLVNLEAARKIIRGAER